MNHVFNQSLLVNETCHLFSVGTKTYQILISPIVQMMILLLVRWPYFIIVPMIFHEVLMFPTIFHMFTFQNFHISNYVHHLFQWFSLSLPHFAASLLKVANFGSMTSKPLAWRKPGKTSENQWHCLLFLNEFLKIFNSSFFDQFSMFLAWFFQVFSGFPVPKRPFLATSHVEGHFLLLHLFHLQGGVIRSAGGPARWTCRWWHVYRWYVVISK